MANNRHFWRKGEFCRVMTLDEIKEELRVKETSLGLWTSDSKYGEFILAFMPIEYKQMGRIGQIINAEYDYYATVEFEDGKRFEVPCMCLKMVEPNISGKCISLKDLANERDRVIEPTPINIDDIVDLELNDFSDISEEFYAYGIKLEVDDEDNDAVYSRKHSADDMKVASIRTSMLFTKSYLDDLKDSIELMERHLEDLEKELEEYLRK